MTATEAQMQKVLGDMIAEQLKDVQTSSANQIKAKHGTRLYNFLIIDPDLVNEDFDTNIAAAEQDAKYAEDCLQADLEGNIDDNGYLVLPTLREAYQPKHLSVNAKSFLRKLGRAPKVHGSLHPDEGAKKICKIVLAVQLNIPDGIVDQAIKYTHNTSKDADVEGIKQFITNQDKHLRPAVFTFLTKRLQVLIARCGGYRFWLEAGYEARQEVFYDYIHAYPGHIAMNVFGNLRGAFPYAQIFAAKQVNDTYHAFRALIIYQIAQLLEDTFHFAIGKEQCEIAKEQRTEGFHTMCRKGHNPYVDALALPKNFLDYPARPLGPASSTQSMNKIDKSSKKRKLLNPAQAMATLAPGLRQTHQG
ncbi:hypothetical protein KC336_g5754 [Hortaea werneckii]|nr:hypothetical protein KC336_g5754 [Hortaea werneckii]